MDKHEDTLKFLVNLAGFSNTFERERLERLIWLTALDISPLLKQDQWNQIKQRLHIPDDFNKRTNFNYIIKTESEQENQE